MSILPLFRDNEAHRLLAASILILTAASVLVVAAGFEVEAQPSQVGQWSGVQALPYNPKHAQMLPTGKLMFWDSYDNADFPQLWDPLTTLVTAAARANYNIFCTGFSFLPDGRLFVAGGHISDNVGLPFAFIYDPFGDAWSRQSDMDAGRWYPSSTTLPNGDVLVVSGMTDTMVGMNLLPQVWQTATGTWRNLTNAELQLPYYPYIFLAPNGQVFNAGPSQTTRYLETSGTGAWSVVGNNGFGARNWGSAAMYDDGKVLIMGGITGDFYGAGSAQAPTATAEAIDLNSASPSWQFVASMTYPRKHHNATLLPDGTVLVTGGSSGSEDTNSLPTTPVFAAEVWEPTTNQWTVLASNTVYRGYHALALLLPDGRVFSAGGDHGGPSAEIYSPPYLFKGARPTITVAPPSVGYGQTFFVSTPDATSIATVTWIRLSSVTHTNNMGQRINRLNFSQTTGGLNVTAPSGANQAPPGYYMLFVLSGNGVPSVAKFVRLDAAGAPTTPAAPVGLTASSPSSSRIDLAWTDNSSNEDGFKIERCQGAGCINFAQIATVGGGVTSYANTGLTASTTYQYRIRAYNAGGDSAFSNTASATTLPSAPSAPANPMATAISSSQINLSWTDTSTNEDGFKIERCQGAKCNQFTPIAQVGSNVAAYSDMGLTAATSYTYRVRAYNAVGNSDYAKKVTATTLANPPPAAPSNLAATTISGSQISLSWTDNSTNEDGFKIERCQGAGCTNFVQIAQLSANITNYSDPGLTTSTTYIYRVRAYNGAGNSAYSNSFTATTLPSPPAAPSGLTATAVPATRIDLSWTDNSSNEDGFRIERSMGGASFLEIAVVGANVTTYADTNVAPLSTYSYRLRAYNAGGHSGYSNTATATP